MKKSVIINKYDKITHIYVITHTYICNHQQTIDMHVHANRKNVARLLFPLHLQSQARRLLEWYNIQGIIVEKLEASHQWLTEL